MFKKPLSFLFFFLVLTAQTNLFAQEDSGIHFFEGSLEDAQALAASEDKLLFVDAFAVWCGPCRKMDKQVFSKKEVANYMNAHFVCVRLDVDQEAGRAFAMENEIKYIPDMFFMAPDGKILLRESGYFPPKHFLSIAKEANQKQKGS